MTGQTPAAFRCLIVGLPPRGSPAVEPTSRVSLAALLSTALTAPLHRLLNLAWSPCTPRFPPWLPSGQRNPPVLAPVSPGRCFSYSRSSSPCDSQAGRAFGGVGGRNSSFVFIFGFCLLSQHRIRRGDHWRAFQFCVTKGAFPIAALVLQLWAFGRG